MGIGKIVLSNKQHLAIIAPHDNALVLLLLRWEAEVRDTAGLPIPASTKDEGISKEELTIAECLVMDLRPGIPRSTTTSTWKRSNSWLKPRSFEVMDIENSAFGSLGRSVTYSHTRDQSAAPDQCVTQGMHCEPQGHGRLKRWPERQGSMPWANWPHTDAVDMIRIDGWPQLRPLRWSIKDGLEITPELALSTYERNWRHLDERVLSEAERALLERLIREGGGRQFRPNRGWPYGLDREP